MDDLRPKLKVMQVLVGIAGGLVLGVAIWEKGISVSTRSQLIGASVIDFASVVFVSFMLRLKR